MTNSRRGNAFLEVVLFLPLMVLLLVGMTQIAKFTYTYFSLRKTVYSVASYLNAQQGVNFCNAGDPNIAAAISFGLTGTSDNSLPTLITGLDPTMISVVAQRATATAGGSTSIAPCDCSSDCDISQGQLPPDFIVVSINGYTLTPRIPKLAQMPIPLMPRVKVPYGGT